MPVKFKEVDVFYAKYVKLKREDVQLLMEWMQKQPHLPKAPGKLNLYTNNGYALPMVMRYTAKHDQA